MKRTTHTLDPRLSPGTRLRTSQADCPLVWTVISKEGGQVWLMTPFVHTPVERVPIRRIHEWLMEGTMEVKVS